MSAPTYRGTYDWELDGETLKKFKKGKTGDEFKSPEFEIGPLIKWHLRSNPNGTEENDAGNCQLHLVLSSYPIHFTNIIIFYQLHCAQTASNFSAIKSFKKVDESVVWFRGVFRNDELINLPETVKKLAFQCSINILRLESGENVLFEYPLDIDFKKKSQFVLDWKIKDDMLQKFQTAKHGKFVSDNTIHDNMWSLQCAPNGYRANDHGSVRLFMQLCALPPGIKSVHLSRKLECIDKEVTRAKTKDLPWGYDTATADIAMADKNNTNNKQRQNSGWSRTALLRRCVSHLDEINFRATIDIKGYTTYDGKKINIAAAGKKRKRSSATTAPKIDVNDMEVDGEEKKEAEDGDDFGKKPPKKKRKTSTKDTDKKKKKSEKEEQESEEDGDGGSDMDVTDIKRIEVDNNISGGYEWRLSNDLLRQFKTAKYRKVWQSEEFTVCDLKWVIEVYPAGQRKKDKDDGSACVLLTMVSELDEAIGKMGVCWTLYVKPAGLSYTTISEFTGSNNSFGCDALLSQNEVKALKNTFAEKVMIGCKLTVLNSIETKDLKAKIYKQIYPLKIKNNEDGISGADNEFFSKHCAFGWDIDENLMKQFKAAPIGKYFESSRLNGNMWSLRCAPNGERKEDEGNVALVLQLNAFPAGIGKMKVEFKLKCSEAKTSGLLVHNYTIAKSEAGWNCKLKKSEIESFNSLTFKAFVDITMFYDTKYKRIKTL